MNKIGRKLLSKLRSRCIQTTQSTGESLSENFSISHTIQFKYHDQIQEWFGSCNTDNAEIIEQAYSLINQRSNQQILYYEPQHQDNFAQSLNTLMCTIPVGDKDLLTKIADKINNGIHLDLFANNGHNCIHALGKPRRIIGANLYGPEYHIEGEQLLDIVAIDAIAMSALIPNNMVDSISINGVDFTIIPSDLDGYIDLLHDQIVKNLKPGGILVMAHNQYYEKLSQGFDLIYRYDKAVFCPTCIYQKPLS